MPLGEARVSRASWSTDFGALSAAHLRDQARAPRRPRCARRNRPPVSLPYDRAVATPDGRPSAGGFDGQGRALPAEMLPREIALRAASASSWRRRRDGSPTPWWPAGRRITLPEGSFRRAYVLAASADGDLKATFRAGETPVELTVPDWGGYIGQWDNRIFNVKQEPVAPPPGAPPPPPGRPAAHAHGVGVRGADARLHQARAASRGSPRTATRRTAPTSPTPTRTSSPSPSSCPPGARTMTLPNNERLRILAVTVSDEGAGRAAGPAAVRHAGADTGPLTRPASRRHAHGMRRALAGAVVLAASACAGPSPMPEGVRISIAPGERAMVGVTRVSFEAIAPGLAGQPRFHWDFGDGGRRGRAHPEHVYRPGRRLHGRPSVESGGGALGARRASKCAR